MKRTINYIDGDIPDRLIEYIADVRSPDGISTVAKAHVSRFGYQVKWWDVTNDRWTMDEPDLDAAIGQLTEQMSRTGNKLVDGRYTENAGVDFTDEELEKYTSLYPGEPEFKDCMKRYHDLFSAISTMPWFHYTTCSDGIRLYNIEGIDEEQNSMLFFWKHPATIMVPSALKFPYNVKLRSRCNVVVDKYITIDEAKKDDESDIDCIDRLAKKIADEYREKSAYVDGLISEVDAKVAHYDSLIKQYGELCMKALAAGLSCAQYTILLHDICNAYHALVPGEPIDGMTQLHIFRSMVKIFTVPGTKGTLEGNRVTFQVDLGNLDLFRDMMRAHGYPDGCKSVLDSIDRETREISLVFTWGTGNTLFKLVGVDDPAKSPYVE